MQEMEGKTEVREVVRSQGPTTPELEVQGLVVGRRGDSLWVDSTS